MSLLRNSVIVGGATFLVGSVLMEIGDKPKGEIGWWPYVGTFISGAVGFYLLKQQTVPVPEALELNATTGYGYDDPPERMTDEEGWLEMYDDYLEDEDSPMTLEEYKKWVIEAREEEYQMQVKYEQRLKDEGRDMDGNPIKGAESFSAGELGIDEMKCPDCGRMTLEFPINQRLHCSGCGSDFYDAEGPTDDELESWSERQDDGSMLVMIDEDGDSHTELTYKDGELTDLKRFMAEIFEADRKLRRRTKLTWTRGNEPGFEDETKLPADYGGGGRGVGNTNMTYKGRGRWNRSQVEKYPMEDAYHIQPLPEGYHLHLYKPNLRKHSWMAKGKSPNSPKWFTWTSMGKSNLMGQILDWYNTDIAKIEGVTLSPIQKAMMRKGKRSKIPQIKVVEHEKTTRIVKKREVLMTQGRKDYFAYGGENDLEPTLLFSKSTQEDVANPYYDVMDYTKMDELGLTPFYRGCLWKVSENVDELRSINRWNKSPEAWIKSYPAWFQNACKHKLNKVDLEMNNRNRQGGNMTINRINVVEFLNGKKRYSWDEDVEDKKVDTAYGEQPQFKVLDPTAPQDSWIIPRPSSQRKIYDQSFKANAEGDGYYFSESAFMMAIVDKYKYEVNCARIQNSMIPSGIQPLDESGNIRNVQKVMLRRFKKN